MDLYPKAASFRVRTINWVGDAPWDAEWFYHFRLDYEWKDIEWIDLKARSCAGAISLDEIEVICRRIGCEFERHGDMIRIIGYRKMS